MRVPVAIGLGLVWAMAGQGGSAAEALTLHLSSMPVAPAHTPPVYATVHNSGASPYTGQLTLSGPEGWTILPKRQPVEVGAGGTARVAFTVHRGALNEANRYVMEVRADGAGEGAVVRRQEIVCASAPYFKPTIDGRADDWADAIPVTFTAAGKRTTLRTYWNRRNFAVQVEVEEDALVPWQPGGPVRDAVQLALAPPTTATSTPADVLAQRLELLLMAGPKGAPPHASLLAQPGSSASAVPVDLAENICTDVELAVAREGTTTRYEASIPFSLLKGAFRPGEGREFCFSVLIHDPDGTGLRDWGEAAGLGPEYRLRSAWSDFAGSAGGDVDPVAPLTLWGMCSSKY